MVATPKRALRSAAAGIRAAWATSSLMAASMALATAPTSAATSAGDEGPKISGMPPTFAAIIGRPAASASSTI